MDSPALPDQVGPAEVAGVLTNLADLLAGFHKSDVALQDALSTVTHASGETPNMFELQHVDLVTQAHFDIAKLLPVLAACIRGTPTDMCTLRTTLTLRSLQDSLIDSDSSDDDGSEAGDLSLF